MTLDSHNQHLSLRADTLTDINLKKIDGPNLVSLITANTADADFSKVPQEHRQYLLKHYLSCDKQASLALFQGVDDKVGVLHEVLNWICQDDSRIVELKNLISIAEKLDELEPLIEAMLKSSRYFHRSESALSLLASNNERSVIESIINAAIRLDKLRDILNLSGHIMRTESKTVEGEVLISSNRHEVGSQAILKASFIAGHTELAMYLLEQYKSADLLVDLVDSSALTLGAYHASRGSDDANIELLKKITEICTAVAEDPAAKSYLSGEELRGILKDKSLAELLVGATENVYNGFYYEKQKTRDELVINPVILGLEHANTRVLELLAKIADTEEDARRVFTGSVSVWMQAKLETCDNATPKMKQLFQEVFEAVSASSQISDQLLSKVGEYAWLIFCSEHHSVASRLLQADGSAKRLEQIAWNSPAAKELTMHVASFLDRIAREAQVSPKQRVMADLLMNLGQTSDKHGRELLGALAVSMIETANRPDSVAGISGRKAEKAPVTNNLETELTAVLEIFARIEQSGPSHPMDCPSAAKKLATIFDSKEDALCFLNRGCNWLLNEEAGITGWSHMIWDITGFHLANSREFFDGVTRKQPIEALLNFEPPKGEFKRTEWAKLMMQNPEVLFYIGQAPEIERFAQEQSIAFPDELNQLRSLINKFSLDQLGLPQGVADMPVPEEPQSAPEADKGDDLDVIVSLRMAIRPSLLPSIRNLTASGFFMSTTIFARPSLTYRDGLLPVIEMQDGSKRISTNEAEESHDAEYWAEFAIQSFLPDAGAFDLPALCSLLCKGEAIAGIFDKHTISFNINTLNNDVQFNFKKTLLTLAAMNLPTEALFGTNYRNTLRRGQVHRKKVSDKPETEDEVLAACTAANEAKELPELAYSSPISFTDLDRAAEVYFKFQTSKVGLLELPEYVQETRHFMRLVREFSEKVTSQGAMKIPEYLLKLAEQFFIRLRVELDRDADTRINVIDLS